MRRLILILAPLLAGGSAARDAPLSADWARAALWDDGQAEVAVYESSRVIYGVPRPYRAVLVTVKEDFDPKLLVKADPPLAGRSLVTVLKQNAVREIPTPNYDYRIMTSTFVERADPMRLVKLTSGSHEWCGNTWKAVRVRDGRATHAWSSYFDGEADGTEELDLAPRDLFEDQLPLVLRGLRFADGPTLDVRVAPSLAHNHGGPLRWRRASIRVGPLERLELPVGSRSAFRVDVTAPDWGGSYWFDAAGTHPLVRLETASGESWRLAEIERRAYWVLSDRP